MGSTDNTTVDVRSPLESWFLAHGVPHFMHHYSAGSRVPIVVVLVCVVLAFEVGAAPWMDVDTAAMLLAPLILFAMTLIVLPWLRMLFEAVPKPEVSTRSRVARVVALCCAVELLRLSRLPPADSVMWVNFVLLLCVFATTTMLFSRRLWASAEPALRRRRRLLVAGIVAVVVTFGLEGPVFRSFDDALSGSPLPTGAPALACVAALVLLASLVARSCQEAPPAPGNRAVAVNFQLVAVPLLLLFIGFETTVLPYSHREPHQGWIALGIVALIVLIAGAAALAGRRRTFTPSRGTMLLAVLAPFLVAAYPSLLWAYFELDAFGTTLTGFDAFLVSAGINLLYLGVVWFVVSLGLDRLALWMADEAGRNLPSVAEGVARGLPLLLVFMVFLVMQAELWEVVVEVETWEFWLLVAAMVLFALGFVVLSARRVVLEKCAFEGFDAVADALPSRLQPYGDRLRDGRMNGAEPALGLKRLKYMNALAVIVVYQLIVLVPIAIAAALVFYGIGKLAVHSSVAAEWVYGDAAGTRETAMLEARTFWEEPWTRVAIVLGAFSALYLVVHVLSSPDQRTLFFGGADRAMRRRLAVRAAYVALVPRDPRRDGAAPRRLARRVRSLV